MVRRLCLAPEQNKLERPECQNSSIDGRLGSVHKFSSFLAIQVGQLWDTFHAAVSKNYERLWNRQKRWIRDAVWQPLGLCLFSKGVQLGQSLTRYSTTLQRHMLTEGLRPQPRVMELLPQTTPHCNISKGLIIAVSFTQFLLPCRLSGQITRHTNRQTSKHSLRKYRKHHNHTESNNQGYWNYQTEKLKQLWSVCEELK